MLAILDTLLVMIHPRFSLPSFHPVGHIYMNSSSQCCMNRSIRIYIDKEEKTNQQKHYMTSDFCSGNLDLC